MVMRELKRLQFDSVLDVWCGEGSLLLMIHRKYPRAKLPAREHSLRSSADPWRRPGGSLNVFPLCYCPGPPLVFDVSKEDRAA